MMRLLRLFIFWTLWFLVFSTRTVFSPLLPLIEDTLSLSHGQGGGLFLSLSVGNSLTVLITGRFGPAWGYRRIIVCGFMGIGLEGRRFRSSDAGGRNERFKGRKLLEMH